MAMFHVKHSGRQFVSRGTDKRQKPTKQWHFGGYLVGFEKLLSFVRVEILANLS